MELTENIICLQNATRLGKFWGVGSGIERVGYLCDAPCAGFVRDLDFTEIRDEIFQDLTPG